MQNKRGHVNFLAVHKTIIPLKITHKKTISNLYLPGFLML